MRHFFRKPERLSNKKLITRLFKEGDSFFIHPIRVRHLKVAATDSENLQVLLVVSKKNFKSAVQRNRIKRIMREAWRINKDSFTGNLNPEFCLITVLHYTAAKEETFSIVEQRIKLILRRLQKQYEEFA